MNDTGSSTLISPDCACGCGGKTRGGWFRPGHDAKHVAFLFSMVRAGLMSAGQALEKLDITAEIPSDGASANLYNKLVQRLTRAGYTYNQAWDRWISPETIASEEK